MTTHPPNRDFPSNSGAHIRVIVATHSREIKTALFLALNADPTITIVATATSTAELITYWQVFRPDTVIAESGLPGQPLGPVLAEIRCSAPEIRLLVIDEQAVSGSYDHQPTVEVFTDLDQLIARFPE